METASVETIVRRLEEAKVRYLIAGGLAVVAHGYVRFTADLDLMLDFDRDNLDLALKVFSNLQYRPRAPVGLEEFADAAKRASWMLEKDLKVFSLWSPAHPATEVDLFVDMPIDFGEAYSRAARFEPSPGLKAAFVSFDDLITLKEHAHRPRDLDDIEQLKALRRDQENG